MVQFRQVPAVSPATIEKARGLGAVIAVASSSQRRPAVDPPPIHNISRWWDDDGTAVSVQVEGVYSATPPKKEATNAICCCRVLPYGHHAVECGVQPPIHVVQGEGRHPLCSLTCNAIMPMCSERSFPLSWTARLTIPGSCPVVTGDARQPSRFLQEGTTH